MKPNPRAYEPPRSIMRRATDTPAQFKARINQYHRGELFTALHRLDMAADTLSRLALQAAHGRSALDYAPLAAARADAEQARDRLLAEIKKTYPLWLLWIKERLIHSA